MDQPQARSVSQVPPDVASGRLGVACAAGAFFIWGVVPLYFGGLSRVSAFEIIAHRVVWSAVFVAALIGFRGRLTELASLVARGRLLARLGLTSALVAVNWLTFVWAVTEGRVLETSLGYFITPQVNVILGLLFLGERLRPGQWLAVGLAAAGVVNQVWQLGQLPWISLVLAISFGLYGLYRKQIKIDPVMGLMLETLLATPFAVAYLIHLAYVDRLGFGQYGSSIDVRLILLGVVTAVPLMLFAAGAQRLRMTTVGFLQYIAPSITFVLAVFVFHEPLGRAQAFTFALIWAGVLVYLVESRRALRA